MNFNLPNSKMTSFLPAATPAFTLHTEEPTICFNNVLHQVDSITHCKKTQGGSSLFELTMYCACCLGRTYWFSRKEIQLNGSATLERLAIQAEEYQTHGIDIRSQDTLLADELMDFLEFDDVGAELMNFSLEAKPKARDDSYFNISSDDEQFDQVRTKKRKRQGSGNQ